MAVHGVGRSLSTPDLGPRGSLSPEPGSVFVYFGSGPQYVYQIRDWLVPLASLAENVPVAIVVRDPRVALQW